MGADGAGCFCHLIVQGHVALLRSFFVCRGGGRVGLGGDACVARLSPTQRIVNAYDWCEVPRRATQASPPSIHVHPRPYIVCNPQKYYTVVLAVSRASWLYTWVVAMWACPSSSCTERSSMPFCSMRMANE